MKPCKKCGATDRNLGGKCRPCQKSHSDAWYKENKERHKALGAIWSTANIEKKRASSNKWAASNREYVKSNSSAYHKANKEKRSTAGRAWRHANPEKAKALIAAWFKSNPEKVSVYVNRYRSSKLNATPAWADQRQIEEFYFTAHMLGMHTGEFYQVDHIVPLQSKLVCGLHCEANLQILEAKQNIIKGNRYWPDMPN